MPGLPNKHVRLPMPRLAVLVTLLLAGLFWAGGLLQPASSLPAVAQARQTDLSQLPITFPVQSPEVAAYFHEFAGPEDSASVPPEQLFLLSQDSVGQKMVAFRSFADAQQELDTLTSPVDMVMYNPEHWELTPEEEQEDLAAIIQQFAAFAHERGLRFMFAPDRRYAEEHLDEVAPDIDAVLLQGQRLQHDPQTFAAWVIGMAEIAHNANPDIQVFVQVGATRGTAAEMYAAIQTVASDIDGIAVWSMPRTLHVLKEFVELVRENPPVAEAAPTTTPAVAPATPAPTEDLTPIPVSATAAPGPVERLTAPPEGAPATPGATQDAVPAPTGQNGGSAAISPSPVAPTSVPSQDQTGPYGPDMGWVTDVLLFVGGTGLGLVIGFFLGWSLRRGSRG